MIQLLKRLLLNFSLRQSREKELETRVINITLMMLDSIPLETFRNAVADGSRDLAEPDLDIFTVFYYGLPVMPHSVRTSSQNCRKWEFLYRYTILEFIYNIKAPSLPFFRKIMNDDRVKDQASILDCLLRLAAEGIEQEAIIRKLNTKLSDYDEQVLRNTAKTLLHMAKKKELIKKLLDDVDNEKFNKVVSELKEGVDFLSQS